MASLINIAPGETSILRIVNCLRGAVTFITGMLVSRGHILGTATNDSAAAGEVGEVMQSFIGSGAPVSIASGVPFNLASLSLTPGDWEVLLKIQFVPAATTSITRAQASGGAISATLANTAVFAYNSDHYAAFVPGAGSVVTCTAGVSRQSLAATTTFYLVGQLDFTVSTATAWGGLRARRMR